MFCMIGQPHHPMFSHRYHHRRHGPCMGHIIPKIIFMGAVASIAMNLAWYVVSLLLSSSVPLALLLLGFLAYNWSATYRDCRNFAPCGKSRFKHNNNCGHGRPMRCHPRAFSSRRFGCNRNDTNRQQTSEEEVKDATILEQDKLCSKIMSKIFSKVSDSVVHPLHHADEYEEDYKEIRIFLDVPGIGKDHMKITVDDDENILNISGKRSDRSGEEPTFTRRFALHKLHMDSSKLTAELKNGVLSLSIPKKERPEPREIRIGQSPVHADNSSTNNINYAAAAEEKEEKKDVVTIVETVVEEEDNDEKEDHEALEAENLERHASNSNEKVEEEEETTWNEVIMPM